MECRRRLTKHRGFLSSRLVLCRDSDYHGDEVTAALNAWYSVSKSNSKEACWTPPQSTGEPREDIDVLNAFIGPSGFTMSEALRSIDAAVFSILRHIVDTPFNFEGKFAKRPRRSGCLVPAFDATADLLSSCGGV